MKPAEKFRERRQTMIDVACGLLNRHGAQGFRRADVATALKLDTSTLAYYFKKRDDLVAACLERSIDWIETHASRALDEPDHRRRSEAYLKDSMQLLANQRLGRSIPLPVLSDLTTLSDGVRETLDDRLAGAFNRVADFHPAATSTEGQIHRRLSANLLLNIIFWIPAWDDRYRVQDFLSLYSAVASLLSEGLLTSSTVTDTSLPDLEPEAEDSARQDYLKAATRLINRFGYKGARVDLIAADLGLSTGSFYHHLKTKDEVVMASFDRSFAIINKAFELASTEPTPGARLARIARLIGHHQISAEVPLLRAASYQALPEDLRIEALRRTDQLIHHMVTLIAAGIADGSVKPTEPVMAANSLFASFTGLSGLSRWMKQDHPDEALRQFMHTLESGIYT